MKGATPALALTGTLTAAAPALATPIQKGGPLALPSRMAIAAAALLLAGIAAAKAGVITGDPILPPQAGAYVGTSGGAGCFPAFGVCAEPGKLYGFIPISSTFDAADQEPLFDATYTTTDTNLAGVPLGTITFDGEMGETVFGRTAPDKTGAWHTEITTLDLDGILTGPLAGVSGGIGLDPGHASDGETTIVRSPAATAYPAISARLSR
jgi:hypothetical protein